MLNMAADLLLLP